MIHPIATTEAGRLLALVVAGAGELDLEALALRMYPPPVLDGTASYLYWRSSYLTWQEEQAARRARVSRLLGRLRACGLVEAGRGAPRLEDGLPDPFTVADWRRRRAALAVCDEEWDGDEYDPTAGGETAGGEAHVGIVSRIRAGAATVADAVGTSGSAWLAYRQLVDADVVIPPGRAVASAAGVAMVDGWKAPGA